MYICFTCKCNIPEGAERKWGKTSYKCEPCMKAYNAAKMARNRAKGRGPDWQPKSVPRHAMLDCFNGQHCCTGCNSRKPFEEFPRNRETPCGFDPRCKQCRHEARRERMGAVFEKPRCVDEVERTTRRQKTFEKSRLVTLYNITEDMYSWLLAYQNALCFLCGESDQRVRKDGQNYNLAVDHDHRCCNTRGSCGSCVRHLLCNKCNYIIGIVESKPKLIARFADYIDLRPLKNYPGEGNW